MMLTINITAQEVIQDEWFISGGLDPVIASGLNKLDGSERVGAGKLNYLIQFGREGYEEGRIGSKFGLQWEQFNAINYASGGVFGGATFSAPKLPFTNLTLGDFWYTTGEINIIKRVGLEDSLEHNPDDKEYWALGLNLGIKIEEPFDLPFDLDLLLNGKDRADIRGHFGSSGFKDTFIVSSYVLLTYNF